jgi:hypothetical protein
MSPQNNTGNTTSPIVNLAAFLFVAIVLGYGAMHVLAWILTMQDEAIHTRRASQRHTSIAYRLCRNKGDCTRFNEEKAAFESKYGTYKYGGFHDYRPKTARDILSTPQYKNEMEASNAQLQNLLEYADISESEYNLKVAEKSCKEQGVECKKYETLLAYDREDNPHKYENEGKAKNVNAEQADAEKTVTETGETPLQKAEKWMVIYKKCTAGDESACKDVRSSNEKTPN